MPLKDLILFIVFLFTSVQILRCFWRLEKITNGHASSYLSDLLKSHIPSWALSSQRTGLLSVHRGKKEVSRLQGLHPIMPRFLWNNLPAEIRQWRWGVWNFETHLFTLTFSSILYVPSDGVDPSILYIITLNSERKHFVWVKNTHKCTLWLFEPEEKAAVDVYELDDTLIISFLNT